MILPPSRSEPSPAIPGRPWWLLAAPALVLSVATAGGCSGRGAVEHPTHVVTGRAEVKGKVPVGAQIVFHPVPEKPGWGDLPSAVVRADGTFTVSTYRDGDGAPAGDYVVTAQWFPVGEGGAVGANALDRSLAVPSTSPLRVTIAAGANDLPPLQLGVGGKPASGR